MPETTAPLKVYILGPMRGYPEFNFPAFFAAEERLKALGFEVFNPARMDQERDGFNTLTDVPRRIRDYMKRDLSTVCDMDFLYALQDWEESQGARLEEHCGRVCGIPVFEVGKLNQARATVLRLRAGYILAKEPDTHTQIELMGQVAVLTRLWVALDGTSGA
jgi:hypothetical protein